MQEEEDRGSHCESYSGTGRALAASEGQLGCCVVRGERLSMAFIQVWSCLLTEDCISPAGGGIGKRKRKRCSVALGMMWWQTT